MGIPRFSNTNSKRSSQKRSNFSTADKTGGPSNSKLYNDIDSLGDIDFSTDGADNGEDDGGWSNPIHRNKRFAKSIHFYSIKHKNSIKVQINLNYLIKWEMSTTIFWGNCIQNPFMHRGIDP